MAVDYSQKVTEDELKVQGTRLINPPHSTEDLLHLLDEVEYLLMKVGQAPSDSMKDALLPVMSAMIGSELLKHAHVDVKVSVASCMIELIRITAPRQPYNDGLMEEIFQLTVRALEGLSHSGPRYYKAVHILEIMADVKAGAMLLDLELDTLVKEIIQLFLRVLRPYHPNIVLTKMAEVMILLLQENDEISMELLQPILDRVKKENQISFSISSKLAEKVLKECASIVKPFLVEAFNSTSLDVDDYGELVASISYQVTDREQMMANGKENPGEVGPSAAVISETLPENGTLNTCGTSSKTLKKQQSSRKNESVSNGDEMKLENDGAIIEINDIEGSGEEAIKPSFGDDKSSKKRAKSKRLRKITMRMDEDSKQCCLTKNYGEEIVGSRIKVWWPLDKVFYEGTVASFDSVKKKHKILYDDNIVENLYLHKQRFEILEGNISAKKNEADGQSSAVSSTPSNRISDTDFVDFAIPLEIERWGMPDDIPSEKEHVQNNGVSSLLSTEKKAKRTPSTKKELGASSTKRPKINAKKDGVESLDIIILDDDTDAEDNPSDKVLSPTHNTVFAKHATDIQSNAVSSALSTKKKTKRTSTKMEPGVSSSKRSKRNVQKSEIEAMDTPILANMNDASITVVDCEARRDLVDKGYDIMMEEAGIEETSRY